MIGFGRDLNEPTPLDLSLTRRIAESDLGVVFEKLGVADRLYAVIAAQRLGQLSHPDDQKPRLRD